LWEVADLKVITIGLDIAKTVFHALGHRWFVAEANAGTLPTHFRHTRQDGAADDLNAAYHRKIGHSIGGECQRSGKGRPGHRQQEERAARQTASRGWKNLELTKGSTSV